MRTLLLLLPLATVAFGQLPDMYRQVDRLTWVVKDVKPVMAGWEKMGVAMDDLGIVEHKVIYLDNPSSISVRKVAARIGDVLVEWVQPLEGNNAFSEFLSQHGEGVFSLVHRAPSERALEEETVRLKAAGVGVLQRVNIEGDEGSIHYIYFDTAKGGKYTLGLVYVPPDLEEDLPTTAGLGPVSQFAFVVRDLRAVSAYWQKLGFPAMDYSMSVPTNRVYRGQPGRFSQEQGWHRYGKVVYEWLQPIEGPTVYQEFLNAHGEGFHHLAFNTAAIEPGIAPWTAAGFAISQAGDWGEKGKPGSGHFTYIDTETVGGVTMELLWSYTR